MEKATASYLSRVRRYLNLPRERKDQVIQELTASITERKAQGLSEAEILQEMGSPRQVAAAWNEQLKEYAYRKSPWRFAFLAMACYGALEVLMGIAAKILYLSFSDPFAQASSIGIIGGADGPTAIFVTTSVRPASFIYVILLLVGIVGYGLLCRCKKK